MEQTLLFIYFRYYNSFRPYHSFGILLSRFADLSDSVVCCVVSGTEDALISDTSCQSVQTETYLHFRPPPLDPICHPDFLKINLDTVWIWHTTDLGLKGLGDVNFMCRLRIPPNCYDSVELSFRPQRYNKLQNMPVHV